MRRKGPGKRRRKATRPKPARDARPDSPHRFGHFAVRPRRVKDWDVKEQDGGRYRPDDEGPDRPWPQMR